MESGLGGAGSRPAVARADASTAEAQARLMRWAGTLVALGGGLILLGIITAEALYPGAYTTHANEISDLGGTRPPEGIVVQPSATIFDASMILVGALLAAGGALAQLALRRWSVSTPLMILGVAAIGVGVFPGNTGNPHAICALVTFVAGGVAAVTSARLLAGPLRWLSLTLGMVTLAVLVSYLVLGDAHPMAALGVGGVERWIVYPIVIWAIAFGGYLAGSAASISWPSATSGIDRTASTSVASAASAISQ